MEYKSDHNLPPPQTYCSVCKTQCVLECLKCQRCKEFVHTDCSELPVYAIVNFLNTRSQYTCEQCAKQLPGNEDDRVFAIVFTLLDKEKALKTENNVENTAEHTTTVNKEQSEDSVSERRSDQCAPNQKDKPTMRKGGDHRSTKVCFHYKNNRCKFGRRGRDCPYAHPNLCNKYKVNGLDPAKGCKKGDQCAYLHPPICHGSVRRRECFNLECNRLHLKGTRRYPTDQRVEQQQQQQQQTTAQPPRTSSSTRPMRISPERASTQPQTYHVQNHQTDPTVYFLVQQMQQMQQIQQQILQSLKMTPWQWGSPPPQVPQ